MAKAIFNAFLELIKKIVNLFLTPINALVSNLFPDLTQIINVFNSAVSQLIGGGLGFFAHLLPPYARTLILLYLGLLVSYYTITVSVHVVLKVIQIIKKIKIW